KMVVLNFDHELGLERPPLRRTTGGPSAWAAGRTACEPRRRHQSFELARQRFLVAAANGRGETDVMQKTITAFRPLRKTRQRKPSHFGSYCQPLPVGISSTESASIGAKGGRNLRPPTRRRRANDAGTVSGARQRPRSESELG